LAVVVFRSFYGSSEPGTTSHDGCNPVESVAPPFDFILPFEWLPAPTATPEPGTHEAERLAPLYHVILLDDDDHTYDYVIEMLGALFFLPVDTAFQHAVEVDTKGRTIVITCELPQAEYARDQIHGYGADPRMPRSKGSMKAVIQPVYSGPS
jgi:ATP-dependent Clp protease adaptor protein ClpS